MNTIPSAASQGSAQNAIDQLNAPSTLPRQNAMASLDQGDFLRLLTTQLTLQDPLEPTDNEEMLAQMAQFSSLAASTESSATLTDISTKLDALIEAQEAALEAANAAAQAAASAAASAASAAAGAPSVQTAAPVTTLS